MRAAHNDDIYRTKNKQKRRNAKNSQNKFNVPGFPLGSYLPETFDSKIEIRSDATRANYLRSRNCIKIHLHNSNVVIDLCEVFHEIGMK